MAVAFDLNKGVIRPKDVFEKYDPNIPLRWLRFENAILGVEPLLNLLASDLDNDDGGYQVFAQSFRAEFGQCATGREGRNAHYDAD